MRREKADIKSDNFSLNWHIMNEKLYELNKVRDLGQS